MSRCERLFLPFLLGSLSILPSCKRARSTGELVTEVEAKLTAELGTEVKVHCPTMTDRTYHYCTAEVPGHDDLAFPVRIEPHGDELGYTTKRWVTGARMVDLGTHHLEEKLDLEVDSMTCPMISHMPDGTTVRCQASAEGVSIPVDVRMVIEVRKLGFAPVGGVVFGDRAAEAAHQKLHYEENVEAEVKCARRVVVSVPGKRFECEATLPDETTRTIHFLITGADGTFEVGTEPPKGASPEDAGKAEEAEDE